MVWDWAYSVLLLSSWDRCVFNYLILRVEQTKRLHYDCSNNQPSLITVQPVDPYPYHSAASSIINLTSVRCVLLSYSATHIVYLFRASSFPFPFAFPFLHLPFHLHHHLHLYLHFHLYLHLLKLLPPYCDLIRSLYPIPTHPIPFPFASIPTPSPNYPNL